MNPRLTSSLKRSCWGGSIDSIIWRCAARSVSSASAIITPAGVRAEQLRLAADRADVGVAGDRPEAGAVGLGCQCTGSLARSQAYCSHGCPPANAAVEVRSIAGAPSVIIMDRLNAIRAARGKSAGRGPAPDGAHRFSRLRRRHLPAIPVAAAVAVAAAVWVRKVVLPARPDDVGTARPHRIPDPDRTPAPDGAGVRLAVNPGSGPAWTVNPVDELRRELPAADIHELRPGDDLAEVLARRPATASSPSAPPAATAR